MVCSVTLGGGSFSDSLLLSLSRSFESLLSEEASAVLRVSLSGFTFNSPGTGFSLCARASDPVKKQKIAMRATAEEQKRRDFIVIMITQCESPATLDRSAGPLRTRRRKPPR